MNKWTRREMIAGSTMLGAASGVVQLALAEEARPTATPGPSPVTVTDTQLAMAKASIEAFFFFEQQTFSIKGDGHTRNLVIEPALDEFGRSYQVIAKPGVVRLFRADASRDEFTRQGGLYWSFFGQKGSVRMKKPGGLIMLFRDFDDVVRLCSLELDLRC